jgi:hypothetical protein
MSQHLNWLAEHMALPQVAAQATVKANCKIRDGNL